MRRRRSKIRYICHNFTLENLDNRPGLSLVLIAKQVIFNVHLSLSDSIGMHQKHGHAVPVGRSLTGVTFCRDGTEGAAGGQKYAIFGLILH